MSHSLTNSLIVCLFFFSPSFLFSPTAQQDPLITEGVGRALRTGRHALRIDMSRMEKMSGHLENGRDKERSGFGDGEYEETD